MFSNFSEANEYLETLIPEEYRSTEALKLERINYLLKLLDNPHKRFKSIHIGGTSGKGSVAYFLSQLLTSQGYKTGLHISPHLQSIKERMKVSGKIISDESFVNILNKIKPLAEKTEKDLGLKKPTYFETTVAMAFYYFAEEKVDIAVVEVGLGGKLDATNVIEPIASIITNVDLDHTDILGDTVEKIAEDKSGIIKKNTPVISGSRKLAVRKVIAKKAKKNNSPIYLIGEKFNYKVKSVSFSGVVFNFYWQGKTTKNNRLSIPAIYQVENASLALTAINLLKEKGFRINGKKLHHSLKSAKVPGRFEIITSGRRTGPNKPLIILDGAHNPVKVKTFLKSLTKIIPDKKFVFLVAFKKGKDIEQMLKLMKPCVKTFVITQFSKITDMGKHFTTPAEDIEKILKKLNFSGEILVEKNSVKALNKAKKIAGKDNTIITTGSLYLIGEIRDIFFPNRN
jgi:dihydrofolate synthase/folylpolyglutamate synthase